MSAPTTPAAVLWDFDGTLMDTEPLWRAAEEEVARGLGGELPAGFHAAHVGGRVIDCAADLRAVFSASASAEAIAEELWARCLRRLGEGPIPWQAGAQELVTELHAAGVPQAVVSSSRRDYLDVVLSRLDAGLFAAVISGDDVARHKPDPEPYLTAARALGVRPAECVVVEDSVPGVGSARGAGCAVVVVPTAGEFTSRGRLAVRPSLVGLGLADLAALARRETPRRAQPPQQPPPVQWLALRYCKRGRARFTSHQDFSRAFERALRRAGVPMAYSSGFNPHPRISFANASATGAATEAEYLEIGLAERRDPAWIVPALTAALPEGMAVLAAVESTGRGLGERLTVSRWRVDVSGPGPEVVADAVAAFLAADELPVERLTKNGVRRFDARGPVLALSADAAGRRLDLLLEHRVPAVRPDDVVQALGRAHAGFVLTSPALATRLEQGAWQEGRIVDPFDHPAPTGS